MENALTQKSIFISSTIIQSNFWDVVWLLTTTIFLIIHTKNIIIISIHHGWGYLFWHQDNESQNKTYKKLHESLIFNYINSLHTYRTCYVHYYSSTNIHFSTTPSTKKKKKITVFDNLVEQNQTTLLNLLNQPANKLKSELLISIFWLLEKKKFSTIN